VSFIQVQCPTELTSRTGCARTWSEVPHSA
jgi:hypothetical protein